MSTKNIEVEMFGSHDNKIINAGDGTYIQGIFRFNNLRRASGTIVLVDFIRLAELDYSVIDMIYKHNHDVFETSRSEYSKTGKLSKKDLKYLNTFVQKFISVQMDEIIKTARDHNARFYKYKYGTNITIVFNTLNQETPDKFIDTMRAALETVTKENITLTQHDYATHTSYTSDTLSIKKFIIDNTKENITDVISDFADSLSEERN